MKESKEFLYVGPDQIALIGHGELSNGDTFTPDHELVPGLLAHPHFKLQSKKSADVKPVNDEASKEV